MSQRWKIFFVLAFIFTVGFFYRVSMAVVSKDLVADLGITAAELGAVSGIFFYAFAFAQLPLGPMIDRHGGRMMISIFGIATLCGSVIFALSSGYLSALAGRALLGLGTACVLMGSLKIFTNWFSSREFPKVSGLMIATGNLGSLGATAPLAYAISRFSWRPTFCVMALVQAAATIAVFLFVRDTPATGSKVIAPPLESGVSVQPRVAEVWKTLSTSPDFWLVSMIAFFWYANYMVLLALWGGPYLMEGVGLSRSQSGTLLLCTSIGFISGSLFIGKVIDLWRGSLEKTILTGQTLLLLSMTIMLGPAEHLPLAVLAVFFFIIGLVSASGTLIYPLARKLVPFSCAATAMTSVNFFLLLGAATMQHLMGFVISDFPRGVTGYPAAAYHAAFAIPIAGLAVTLLLYRERQRRKPVATI